MSTKAQILKICPTRTAVFIGEADHASDNAIFSCSRRRDFEKRLCVAIIGAAANSALRNTPRLQRKRSRMPLFDSSHLRKDRVTMAKAKETREGMMPKIDRDGVNIHYEVHGDGPPLILTHGYSSTSAMWQGQVAALSKHYKLVLWDMRGHGRSDYPDDPKAYSEAHTVGDIAALLDAMEAKKAIVGGL